jgi:hypothetical protein
MKKRIGVTVVVLVVVALAAGIAWLAVPAGTARSLRSLLGFSSVDLQQLKGKWQRADGGYVIDIRGVDAGGKLDAAYYNPRSIHVAKAVAMVDEPVCKVFIELRDVNYPGSTYNLVWDKANDCLRGVYYQAALNQSYEVGFERLKP